VIALAIALLSWLVGAIGAWLLREHRAGVWFGVAGAIVGGTSGTAAALRGMTASAPLAWYGAWSIPGGTFALRLDSLAGVFLIPVALVGGLCAIYAVEYLRYHAHGRPVGGALAAYNLLLLSMALVVTASDLVLLLIAWEIMTLSSWALVIHDHDQPSVRAAGLEYLIAAHLATIALFLFVVFWAAGSGNFAIVALGSHSIIPTGVLFVLALVGFGTKAGIVPLHVWLPDAHPAAPSHVSALMSAVMITMGFYGLARVVPLLGEPATWWAYMLMTLGAAGAVGGVLFATVQRDVKRVLAYSTVENAGIVTLAIGVGVLGTALHEPVLAGLAWTAALLHIWNHAFAKALLFLGFGAVAQRAGSRDLDALGGLLRRWLVVGTVVVLGAAAIASLPGLNVFTSEWLLLQALFGGALHQRGIAEAALIGAVGVIAFTGGLAVACFARLVGIGLLGTARTAAAATAPAPGWAMRFPLLMLAAVCVIIAVVPGQAVMALTRAVHTVVPAADVSVASTALRPLAALLPLIVAGLAVALIVRQVASSATPRHRAPTWGCGYAAPTAAMQYSSTSFSEPLSRLMQRALNTETMQSGITVGAPVTETEAWPVTASWASVTRDRVLVGIYEPLFAQVARAGSWLRSLHQARVTTSLVYIVGTMVLLLTLLFLPGVGR
jgi:hydrogenase-4 component B